MLERRLLALLTWRLRSDIGNLAWMEVLDFSGKEAFNSAKLQKYKTKSGIVGGETKSVGHGAGNFTYLQVSRLARSACA